ncbi:MAG TPA: hypothetical protein VLA34_05900, partial [Candidatus Krumholzibacterium sp.]|nr:hypothetical protein [Candidatus Krumholzibacterium sp.]
MMIDIKRSRVLLVTALIIMQSCTDEPFSPGEPEPVSSWIVQNPESGLNDLRSIAVIDGARLIVTGSGGSVYLSEDNGETWGEVRTGISNNLYRVSFLPTGTG